MMFIELKRHEGGERIQFSILKPFTKCAKALHLITVFVSFEARSSDKKTASRGESG